MVGVMTPAGAGHPATSHEGYRRIWVKSKGDRLLILRAYQIAGSAGAIADEAYDLVTTMSTRRMRNFWTRQTELREGGFIEPNGDVREAKSTDFKQMVSVITPLGEETLRKIDHDGTPTFTLIPKPKPKVTREDAIDQIEKNYRTFGSDHLGPHVPNLHGEGVQCTTCENKEILEREGRIL